MNGLISRQTAIEALERDEEYNADIPNRADGVRDAIITISSLPSAEPKVNGEGDLISREFMKSLGGTCIARRLKDGDLCPIISIDLLPSAEPVKAYTKADYIMALHKEYGCTLTMAEEAHNKALEYLRSKAMMKG